MNWLVSVIIPVYNCAAFLHDCIESVMLQTLKDVEIVIVDDGSTDESWEVIQDLQTIYPRNIFAFHTDNRGAWHARNVGIEHSHGLFIAFLDSDDFYYNHEALEKMVCSSLRMQLDVCGSYRVELRKGQIVETGFLKEFSDVPQEGRIIKFVDYQYDFYFQSFIYRREMLEKNCLVFPPFRRYEDPVFFLKVMDLCQVFYLVPYELHCYRKGHQNYESAGRYINHTLRGIREELLIAGFKYPRLFDSIVTRLKTVYLEKAYRFYTPEVESLLNDIKVICRKTKRMNILDELSESIDSDGEI